MYLAQVDNIVPRRHMLLYENLSAHPRIPPYWPQRLPKQHKVLSWLLIAHHHLMTVPTAEDTTHWLQDTKKVEGGKEGRKEGRVSLKLTSKLSPT